MHLLGSMRVLSIAVFTLAFPPLYIFALCVLAGSRPAVTTSDPNFGRRSSLVSNGVVCPLPPTPAKSTPVITPSAVSPALDFRLVFIFTSDEHGLMLSHAGHATYPSFRVPRNATKPADAA
ncbi:hypothetical protein K488DRAFT_87605 [Vararia minispora EC-137]|uniref:Uncharacterized protein n=1 Tax=Vararia minispora EC-137 TaxID=1314806 RepID=A0ACB8QG83_9AGAM|nr:hypothetical protein K488DRAFT_87605 [Vararia minispora EC-137]